MAVSQSLTLTLLSQDIINCKSEVRILWTSTQTGASYNNSTSTGRYRVKQNGRNGGEFGAWISLGVCPLPKNSTVEILNKTIEVQHLFRNGQGDITVEVEMDTRISAGVVKKGVYLVLPDIKRASLVSAGSANVGETLRISVTRYSSLYTHTITYRLSESVTGTIVANSQASTIDWTVPTSFYAQLPNKTSYTGEILCTTYYNGSVIGTSSTPFTVYIPPSAAPIVSATVHDVNPKTLELTGDSAILVKGHSNAEVNISAEPQHSATISSYKCISGDGKTLTEASGIIPNAASGSFSCSVTDSRKYTTSEVVNLMMIDYFAVSCIMSVQPVNGVTGEAVLTANGTFFNAAFGAADNTLAVQYRYTSDGIAAQNEWIDVDEIITDGNKYEATAVIPGLDYTKLYTFQMRAVDALSEHTTQERRVKTIPVFDWGENDFNFNVPVQAPEINTDELTGDAARLQKSICVTAELSYSDETPQSALESLYPDLLPQSVYHVYIKGGSYGSDAAAWVMKATDKYGFAAVRSYDAAVSRNINCRILNGEWNVSEVT